MSNVDSAYEHASYRSEEQMGETEDTSYSSGIPAEHEYGQVTCDKMKKVTCDKMKKEQTVIPF